MGQKRAASAALTLDEHLDHVVLLHPVRDDAVQRSISRALASGEVERAHVGEQGAKHGHLRKRGGSGDARHGQADLGQAVERVAHEQEVHIATVVGAQHDRMIGRNGSQGRL